MNSKTSSTTPADKVPEVAVVILNWNGVGFLKKFLPSVINHSRNKAVIWVADNGSSDDSVAWLRAEHPEVHIWLNHHNYGFARGYNLALANIPAHTYVLLNSDVEVTPEWISPVLDYMQASGVVACQPKIRDFHRKTWFEHAGATGGFIDRNGFVFCSGRIFNTFEEDRGQYNSNKEVFWASGACLFIRSEVYHQIGGLDEDFFAHMEEIDLCWRLKNAGYGIGACGESHVYHVGGGTLDKHNPFKTYLNFRNNLYILVKNYHYGSLLLLLLKRMVLDGIAAFRFITEGKFSYFTAVFKAHLSFYGSLGTMLRKRRAIKVSLNKSRAIANRKGWYQSSIVRDYFFKGKTIFRDLDQADFL